jgi:class 3 adenylate cyclase
MIVSNTTPLSNLIQLDLLILLSALWGHVTIPQAVAEELDQGYSFFGVWREVAGANAIDVVSIAADPLTKQFLLTLHAGAAPPIPTPLQTAPQAATRADHPMTDAPPAGTPRPSGAARRQLTVLFCDLVDSTALSSQLDPEDYREVVRAYQEASAAVIQRFDGYIAQYLGDGLLVYFSYPQAHEDDAQRAVRAGLGIVEALELLNARLESRQGVRLAVRLGIHTGLVVGEMGGGNRQEQLALGETPNVAARLQGLAAPDTVLVSAATYRLIAGFFVCQELGAHTLRGVAEPVPVYQILAESAAQNRLDAAGSGLTPLVGREAEALLPTSQREFRFSIAYRHPY